MNHRATDGKVNHKEVLSYQDLVNCEQHATAKWFNYINQYKKNKQEYLLDFVPGDEEEKEPHKLQKLAKGVSHTIQRNYDFKYITDHIGKGSKQPL